MASLRIAVAPGDGIGPEIMSATLDLLLAAGVGKHASFEPVQIGRSAAPGRGLTDEAVRTVEECGILFKGPMETAKGTGGASINVAARKLWSAYANLRVFKTLPGVETVYSRAGMSIDMAIVRENIEDTYAGIEHRLSADVAQCKRLISAPGSDEVHAFAFQTARKLGVSRVHCGHKANIMKMTDGLFLERFRAKAREFAGIESADVIIDALCMSLVVRPQDYRLIVLPNLQGDIVSDLCAGLVGGLGFAPSANIGRHISIFEAVHGTAPDIAGQNRANPTSLILSALMMLRHVYLAGEAALIENALLATLESGVHTPDFGSRATPPAGTKEFARAIIDRLGERPKTVPAVPDPGPRAGPFVRAGRPDANESLRTFTGVKTSIAGFDVYLDTAQSPGSLAGALARLAEGTPFRLTLIGNRGTQVWPSGSVFTECVDCASARFECRDATGAGQRDALALLARIGESHTVSTFELLRDFDGAPGYSRAQGQ